MAVGARTRFLVFKRDNFTCQYCGNKAPEVRLQVDHVVAKANGGQDDMENFITSCSTCNVGKMTEDVVEAHHQHNQDKCEECDKIFLSGHNSGWWDSAAILQQEIWKNLDHIADSPDFVAKLLRFNYVFKEAMFQRADAKKSR